MWACKNGDLDQVKAIVEKPVRKLFCGSALEQIFQFICGCVKCCVLTCFFARLGLSWSFSKNTVDTKEKYKVPS